MHSSTTHSFMAATRAPPVHRLSRFVRMAATTEHARYMHEIAVVSTDTKVDLLVKVLQAQGETTVSPEDRRGLMPLLVPITSTKTDTSSDPTYTCILRWPEGHKGMELPVVRMRRNAPTVELVARSTEEYIKRALVEEEAENGGTSGAVAEAAGAEGLQLQPPGAYATSKLPSLNAFLTKNVGMFPDVAEALALTHLQKGDKMSALITGEWYMRRGHFPDWARPYEFNYWLMSEAGRPEESRDVARMALTLPWWSLKDGFEATRDAAGLTGSADDVRAALDEKEEMTNKAMRTLTKTDKQERMDDAAHLLNKAAAGVVGWDDIREAVSEEYMKAGLSDVARFVRW